MRKTLTILACTTAILGWTGAAVANPDPHPTEHPKDGDHKDDHKDGDHKDEHKDGHGH
ncbi:hypothetical protein [Novosphingobium cyanobacteriorum]|uniref:Pentapeptide MXKDX repeat protein n=1 Tax=Novosphingobium cyanobacteriorum TaxID=3024215 RepID=A0ABT6CKC1_9SPHN|nr:hypothetical protein [Novosphingobium cyanobacteriorum]MDF8333998.1 hypothetical protein [Novosphingobium cyanobacteriorum]